MQRGRRGRSSAPGPVDPVVSKRHRCGLLDGNDEVDDTTFVPSGFGAHDLSFQAFACRRLGMYCGGIDSSIVHVETTP